ncbi:MAG: hypothetical protein C0601_11570 [Candidatus Muiribacterium halophilum]|uniref:Type II secretion system protein GspG C-terminal domain-containing protein n=1 Tax=Muiribacterium halophilum TaxID=2053465 RepID=A0A2N5ZBD2_MUIH1|nr:MAG: hypothetical protein C0601_11570 [Candidatus Muirbacterium halophilum]
MGNKKGFSLVELMIVVAIIGILVAALLPQLSDMIEKAKASTTRQSMKAMVDAITRYNATESQEISNLNWLVPKYLKEIKPDPWGSPYVLLPDDGVIISYGPDRQYNSDISSPAANLVNRDNIEVYYKPKLRITEAKVSIDRDGNSRLNNGDRFTIFFTKPAGGDGSASQSPTITPNGTGTDFDFLNCYDPSTPPTEGVIGLNAATAPTAAGTNYFSSSPGGMAQDPTYLDDLDGSGVSAIVLSLCDKTTGAAGGTHPLNGDANSIYLTFEVVTSDNTEITHDLYVQFDATSTDPATGTYFDKRGIKAVANGYAVKVEPSAF